MLWYNISIVSYITYYNVIIYYILVLLYIFIYLYIHVFTNFFSILKWKNGNWTFLKCPKSIYEKKNGEKIREKKSLDDKANKIK